MFKKYDFLQICEFCKIINYLDVKESLVKLCLAISKSGGIPDDLLNRVVETLYNLNTPPNSIKVLGDSVQLKYYKEGSQSYLLFNILSDTFKLQLYDSDSQPLCVFMLNNPIELNRYIANL